MCICGGGGVEASCVCCAAGGLGGGGGAGDPELRTQRFRIASRIAALRRQLAGVAAAREVQRQGRRAAGGPVGRAARASHALPCLAQPPEPSLHFVWQALRCASLTLLTCS
jgi:hypothetical protein